MTDTIEIPKIDDLGVNGPVPDAVRLRLRSDIEQAEILCKSMHELCDDAIGHGDIEERHIFALQALAYRTGRMLGHWTNTGYFDDAEERRIASDEEQT